MSSIRKLYELQCSFHVECDNPDRLNTDIEFTTPGWYSLDDGGVYREGIFSTYSRIRIVPRTVICKFCHGQVLVTTAHFHDGGYVGDECCWDERLRSSE